MTPNGPARRTRQDRLGRDRATTKPMNAAVSIMPSMPMLTTPDRSYMTPHRAPRAIGVASARMIGAMSGATSIEVADELEDDARGPGCRRGTVHQRGPSRSPYERGDRLELVGRRRCRAADA